MDFIVSDNDKYILLENTKLYNKMNNIKIVEFLVKNNRKLIFIEAKNSAPCLLKDSDFIKDITSKFVDSFNLLISVFNERLSDDFFEYCDILDQEYLKNCKIIFYLVIYGHKKEWLRPVNDALDFSLISLRKIWNVEVSVINEESAKQLKLIE